MINIDLIDLDEVIKDVLDIVSGDKEKGEILTERYCYDDSVGTMARIMDIKYGDKILNDISVGLINQLNLSNDKKYKIIDLDKLITEITKE